MGKLSGKVAIVTASTQGIGFAIAKNLATHGVSVMISSRKQKNVDNAVSELKGLNMSVEGIVCHVGKKDHRKNLIDRTINNFGGIDILVLNAAVNPVAVTLLQTPEEAFDKIMDVNVKSTLLLTQEVVPFIEKRGGGSVLFVSSMAGLNSSEILGAYSVSKTAMLAMNKALTQELGSKNIRINSIAPGLIRTKFSEALWKGNNEIGSSSGIALGRMGEPDECGGIVSFLASEEGSYISGEVFPISGGVKSRI